MSAMANMLADVLKKSLPPEVVAMLTKENFETFKSNAEALVVELREGMAELRAQNAVILATLEGMKNDGRDDSDGNASAGKRCGNRPAPGDNGSADK